MKTSEQINEIATALAKCQGELKPVPKSTKGHYKGGYADLAECWENCRAALSKNGLAVTQTTDTENDKLVLHTLLIHASGQWIKSTMPLICSNDKDIQKIGGSITYTRRYALCSIVGITPVEDDDGESAKPSKDDPRPLVQFKMSPDMIRELNLIIDECDSEFGERIMKTLHELNPPIRSFGELTIELYERIKAAAIKERDKKRGESNATA